MSSLYCPKDYNYWYILSYAGIDPTTDTDRYEYDEDTETLTVDVSQETLDQALAQYDHQAWLKEIEPKKTELEILKESHLDLWDLVLFGSDN